ncbi:DUF1343 domain-containing protein [Spirosoma sp. KCTC 42546]|uniref:exo-beta-N-acetylmuramidase NamZ family protein n=1 Tax=Spirosoma sp. KCTC 42546 TaxID=2520506 RepID=UPI00115AC8DB|nr:DUF1343 domain-containing protein [Spirosoma sp. KCTC 42546]QDK81700.1 DUF1343 domain-containing protein [Spirosoma sp. KCTC 42546]
MTVEFGVDIFLKQAAHYQHQRLALVTNQAATTAAYVPSRQALLSAGYQIVKLFSPEHGLEAIGEDGLLMPNGLDALTGLPIISLYGNKLQPSAVDLADVDAVILDLPDVGCRFYTYLWTLTYIMEACTLHQKPLILLDRPNPISGRMELAEGPLLNERVCSSFIGRWRMPLRHSCTFGELAMYWQRQRMSTLHLTISKAEGWHREAFSRDWKPSFVPTSPAMVNAEAALLYPGLGLLEATNLSEGRGTATPFQIAGAPWLKANQVTTQFNELGLSGIIGRAITFTPQSGKYAGQLCRGVMFHVMDAASFKPVLSGLLFIKLVYDHQPDDFTWATYPTHVNPSGKHHLDKLLGIPDSESLFEFPIAEFTKTLHKLLICEAWVGEIRPYLLY